MKPSNVLRKSLAAINGALLLSLALLTSVSCSRRDLDHIGGVLVTVNVDWSRYGVDPDNMTVVFYRNGDGVFRTVPSPDVHTIQVKLPAGEYDIIAFNNKYADFDCYKFNPGERGDEFGFVLRDGAQPKPFGIGGISLTVPEQQEIVDEGGNIIRDPEMLIADTIYPENTVWTMNVYANVMTMDQVKSLDGVISGLATGYGPGNGNLTADYALTSWIEAGSPNEILCSILCLGLPETWTGAEDDNTLTFNFVLPDNSKVTRSLGVGHIMDVDLAEKVLSVRVTTSISEYQGSYEIDVEPWEEEQTL